MKDGAGLISPRLFVVASLSDQAVGPVANNRHSEGSATSM
jgi:hypothetical protein